MSQAQQLYRLQQLDSEIDKLKQAITQIESQLGQDETMKEIQAQAKSIEQALQKAQAKMRNLDLEVTGLSDKVSQQEKLLYSGKGLSAKEAANLQDEVASLKRRQGNKEEQLLEVMFEVEELEESLEQTQAEIAAKEADWLANQEALEEQRRQLQAKLDKLSIRRSNQTEIITEENLETYEALRRKKGGTAVTAVKDGGCQTCGMLASHSKILRARSSSDLIYCGGCNRIVYIL